MKLTLAKSARPAFTIIEVAICLAIIGIALVGIIAVLPRGLNTQRDTREETIIGEDANLLIELISNGSHGTNGPTAPDDLTNYVYAVSNYWFFTNINTHVGNVGVSGYTYSNCPVSAAPLNPPYLPVPLNSGSNILSLLSTPEFTDTNGAPIPSLIEGGVSNHVVAYVRAMSGLAAEKPPQTNDIMQGDAFSYRILCVNSPISMDLPPAWQGAYLEGATVYHNMKQWVATNNATATDEPGTTIVVPSSWARNSTFSDQLAFGQREVRLRFLWPQLPNGNLGGSFQSFRTTVGGQLATNISFNGQLLYFYQPQSFVRLP
jgi:prepilin-type N-terminal cleavage/methylation domain-containing protein